MTERPILFSAPMVRALLGGRKTQTRRPVKFKGAEDIEEWTVNPRRLWPWSPEGNDWLACPYGEVGDRLWVKETWGLHAYGDFTAWNRDSIKDRTEEDVRSAWEAVYRADAESAYDYWRPSIFMPRWASRLALEVTGVRVERVQDISEADALAEGIERPAQEVMGALHWWDYQHEDHRCTSAIDSYRSLWSSINEPESWAANPWVWVIELKKMPRPDWAELGRAVAALQKARRAKR